MITLHKYTTEDALKLALKDQPELIGKIIASDENTTIHCWVRQTFDVPSNYAKEILKDYLRENMEWK